MEQQWAVGISYGELVLKGKNRNRFIAKAQRQIERAAEPFVIGERLQQQGKYFLTVPDATQVDPFCKALQKVFGLVYITPALRVGKEREAVREAARYLLQRRLQGELTAGNRHTFKVETTRSDKSFPLTSPEISARIGGDLLTDFVEIGLSVDVHNPEIVVHIDVRDDVFVSVDRFSGMGGLPMKSSGRGLLLLSGGIDSPVAGFSMARRGMEIGCVHFHSYPFTSERARDKALRLAEELSGTVGPMRLFFLNLVKVYTEIHKHCAAKNTTVLSRRMMMRLAERLAERYDYDALITGESLGQVASQTVQGISVVNEVVHRPILRPLIAQDKNTIIETARRIDTYEISIEPYDDCCSIFAPSRPNTKPRSRDMEREESNFPVQEVMEEVLETLEVCDID